MYTILNIIPYIVSEDYLNNLRISLGRHELFYNKIPKFILNQAGYLTFTEMYSVNLGYRKDKEIFYFMLEINPIEPLLKEEISNIGEKDFFKNISFLNLFKHLSESNLFDNTNFGLSLFKNKRLNKLNDTNIPVSVNIILDLLYTNSSRGNYLESDFDYDLEVSLVGYLDKNFNIVKIN